MDIFKLKKALSELDIRFKLEEDFILVEQASIRETFGCKNKSAFDLAKDAIEKQLGGGYLFWSRYDDEFYGIDMFKPEEHD